MKVHSTYRAKKPGTEADRPTLAGGRSTVGAREGDCCCWRGGAFPNPKMSRSDGAPDCTAPD
jgi:hypothetical protein